MVCQYSRAGPVSSEKHEAAPDAGVEAGGGDASGVVTATAVVGGSWALLECPAVITRAAKAANAGRSRTPARRFRDDSLFERLAEHLEDLTPALRAFVQEAHAMVRPRPLARQRDLATPDQPHIRDGMMWGATWPAGDQGRAPAGEAGDAMDARGLKGLGEGHRREDGRAVAGQPRWPRPRGTQESEARRQIAVECRELFESGDRWRFPAPHGVVMAMPGRMTRHVQCLSCEEERFRPSISASRCEGTMSRLASALRGRAWLDRRRRRPALSWQETGEAQVGIGGIRRAQLM
jgi:hypothetical protein